MSARKNKDRRDWVYVTTDNQLVSTAFKWCQDYNIINNLCCIHGIGFKCFSGIGKNVKEQNP